MVIPTETFYSAKSEVDNCCTKGDHLKSQKSLLQCDDISTPGKSNLLEVHIQATKNIIFKFNTLP